MNFQLPKKRVKDFVWFLDLEDKLRYGRIDLVSILIGEDEVNIYYGIMTGTGEQPEGLTIKEDQILETQASIPIPKWHVGDNVSFTYRDEGGKWVDDVDKIDLIDIQVKDNKTVEVYYIFEGDPEFYVHEDEVIGFAEPVVTSQGLEEARPV